MNKAKSTLSDAQYKSMMQRPMYTLTLEEFLAATSQHSERTNSAEMKPSGNNHCVYGLSGLASIIGCSVATASRLKKSGLFDPAISQVNRQIVVDVEKALAIISKAK